MVSSLSRTAIFLDILPIEDEDATLPLNVMMHLPGMQHHISEGQNAQLHIVKTSELTRGTITYLPSDKTGHVFIRVCI
jgi:hypothetical protein